MFTSVLDILFEAQYRAWTVRNLGEKGNLMACGFPAAAKAKSVPLTFVVFT